MRKLLYISLALIAIAACNSDKPGKKIIQPEKMVPVLIDLHLVYAIQAEPTFREISRTVDTIDSHSYIFEKHNITRVEFDSSIAWYSRHPELFTGIYDEVVGKLTRLSDSLDPDQER